MVATDLWNVLSLWASYALLPILALISLFVTVSVWRVSDGSGPGQYFPLLMGTAATVVAVWAARKNRSARRLGQKQVTAHGDPSRCYEPGQEVVMAFRRQPFVWTSLHVPSKVIASWEHRTDAAASLFKLGMSSEAFQESVAEMAEMPMWVDWSLLDDGCRFFVQTWPFVFFNFSWALLGGFGAESASAVLLKSRYWAAKGVEGQADTWMRLRETACWLYDVAAHGGSSFSSGGISWKACLLVRYLHCRTRATIQATGSWDTDKYGEPINQCQIIGTLLGSSALLLQGMEELLGCSLPNRQKEGFIHLWRVIGFLFGIDDEINPNLSLSHARIVMESVFSHGIPTLPDPNLTAVLTRHICESVAYGVRTEFGAPLDAGKVAATAWYFLGDAYGAAIGLPESNLVARAFAVCRFCFLRCVFSIYLLPGGQCLFHHVMGYLFTAMVNSIRRRQPHCRFGVTCPVSRKQQTGAMPCPYKSVAK